MKRRNSLILLILVLALVTLACNMPAATGAIGTGTPGAATPTSTLPPVITATSAPGGEQPTSEPTATTEVQPSATPKSGGQTSSCTYKITFVSDVTIPDYSTITAGKSFTKTWRVRNDGTCAWGTNNHYLHALAYTSGSQLSAPNEVALPEDVNPGDTVDISVNMKAPTTPGTYISNWLFRVDGDPSGKHWVGIGSSGNEPIYALIKVGGVNNTPSTTRVSFKTGATSAAVSGSIGAKQTKGYVLAAMKDQVMMAILSSAVEGPTIKITTANGNSVPGSTGQNSTYAMAALPASQDYIVWVTGGSEATTFSLNITIPSRITFEPGGVSATRNGKVSDHMQVSYVLRASEGQNMKVTLTGSDVGLTIYGLQDGQPLVRAEGGATSFDGTLPATQDYIIVVVPAVDSTTFTLKVTVQ